MAIDRLWVDFSDDDVNRSDLVVRNESDDVYYVSVTPSEVVNPGLENEERRTYTDPEELGLLVTPNRLVLQPGEMRAIRLVSLNRDLQVDRTYRVGVRPQLGEISVAGDDTENRGLALKLLAAFDVLVTVRPESGQPDFSVRRAADHLQLSNNGASSMVLLNGRLCPASESGLSQSTIDYYTARLREDADAEDDNTEVEGTEDGEADITLPLDAEGCLDIPGRRLYAGNSWRIHAASTEFLKFDTRWRASQELQPIEVRCGLTAFDASESEFCEPANSVAEREAAVPNFFPQSME